MIVIDKTSCVGCGHCVPFCPVEAMSVYGWVWIDVDLCIGCQTCIDYCPNLALRWDEE